MSIAAKKSPLGLVAVLCGGVSLVAAVLHFFVGPIAPSQPVEASLAEFAVDVRNAVIAELAGEEYEGAPNGQRWDADRILDLGTVVVGLAAILLAVASFIRREDLRMAGSAVALGGGAIAFQFIALAILMVVGAIVVAAIIGQLGIS
jgi:hypothetical protein